MNWLLDKLTGRAGKVFPNWEGDLHDAWCRYREITFDPAKSVLNIYCWRPMIGRNEPDAELEQLLVVFESLISPPRIVQGGVLPYYELSTIYFAPKDQKVCVCFHAGLSIDIPATSPNFSFRGPTGLKVRRNEFRD